MGGIGQRAETYVPGLVQVVPVTAAGLTAALPGVGLRSRRVGIAELVAARSVMMKTNDCILNIDLI